MKMSAACRLVLMNLWRKRDYFGRKEMLAGDGSFYTNDEDLAAHTELSVKTILRCKRFLQKAGFIKMVPGKYKGCATRYWVIRKPDKKSPFTDLSKPPKMSSFTDGSKGDKLSAKGDKLSSKGCQNVMPTIKEQIEISNGEDSASISKKTKTELSVILKNGDNPDQIRCYFNIQGREKTKRRLESTGYQQSEVNEILRLLEGATKATPIKDDTLKIDQSALS
ncbi:MAG: hypothetical protein ACE14U_04190 [Candidatus Velamenicoccus archaeovorus]